MPETATVANFQVSWVYPTSKLMWIIGPLGWNRRLGRAVCYRRIEVPIMCAVLWSSCLPCSTSRLLRWARVVARGGNDKQAGLDRTGRRAGRSGSNPVRRQHPFVHRSVRLHRRKLVVRRRGHGSSQQVNACGGRPDHAAKPARGIPPNIWKLNKKTNLEKKYLLQQKRDLLLPFLNICRFYFSRKLFE